MEPFLAAELIVTPYVPNYDNTFWPVQTQIPATKSSVVVLILDNTLRVRLLTSYFPPSIPNHDNLFTTAHPEPSRSRLPLLPPTRLIPELEPPIPLRT